MYRFRFLLAASLLAASPLYAQRPVQPQWQVDWGEHYCSMIRLPGEGRSYATSFLAIPGENGSRVMLLPVGSGSRLRGITSIVLFPDGRDFEVTARPEQRGNSSVISLYGLPYDFRDALAGASELQLRAGTETRARIPLGNPRPAVAEHRRCTAEVSREWDVDEAALASLQQRPVNTNSFGLDSGDYPPAALRAATQGRVIVRIDVSPEGRATGCAAVATSGSVEIDNTTCRVILRRGRFRPGLNAAGRPVPARFVSSVTWLLPGPD
jgi:TonB family protein